ncbi:Pro-kumamolisin, activation domain-containing protein [Xylariales sp. AK1849]|nr:Pro-kumamolisin, activation domain-containing protein [Xylariales sp. AK1849]
MMVSNLLRKLACVAALATPALSAVMSRVQLSSKVKLMATPSDDQMMTLSIGLALDNIQQLEGKLRAVSTPGSPDYGKYLDKDEIEALFPPSAQASGAVVDWLERAGVEHISQQGSSINFATTVANANKLLDTKFAYYDVEGIQKLRTRQYSVPDEVAGYIQLIHPTTFFGRTKSMRMPVEAFTPSFALAPYATNATTNCSALITPDCLRKAYNIGHYEPDPASGSRVAFGSFLNQSARVEDLHLFQDAYGIPQQDFSVVLINGGLNHQDINGTMGEANLDAQYENAMSHPLPFTQFITGGSPPFVPNLEITDEESNSNEPYLEYYQYLMNLTNDEIPQVLSQSYGDEEQTVPLDYATRVCDLIGMMGVRGISVLESSGDTGVGAPCLSNDGKNHTEFTPIFPASCPCECHILPREMTENDSRKSLWLTVFFIRHHRGWRYRIMGP